MNSPMPERHALERELADLGLREYWGPRLPAVWPAPPATIGFEFDLNYGLNQGVFDELVRRGHLPAGTAFPPDHAQLTDHKKLDVGGSFADGFKTQRDNLRLEINGTPIKVDDDATFTAFVREVKKFANELLAASKPKRPDTSITVPDIRGHPIWFEHPRTLIPRFPLVIAAKGSRRRNTLRFPAEKDLWAAPQATVTLPLARVGKLILAIDKTAKDPDTRGVPGRALTGAGSDQRLGVRSDLAVKAHWRVDQDRRQRLRANTVLSDGSRLTDADFSPALTGFVTLLVMYMLTGVEVDPRDKDEEFAKGSLPLNVKTPLWQVFASALSAKERLVFKDLYGDAAKRANIFKLAKPGATAAAGATRLFPSRTHWDLDRFFHSPPTWDMLIDLTVAGTPLRVDKPNTVVKAGHAPGDEILFAPLSSKIDFSVTNPRIAIELRRIGFEPVGWRRWEGLMERVRDLTRQLNA
jgi:hypothetical protein